VNWEGPRTALGKPKCEQRDVRKISSSPLPLLHFSSLSLIVCPFFCTSFSYLPPPWSLRAGPRCHRQSALPRHRHETSPLGYQRGMARTPLLLVLGWASVDPGLGGEEERCSSTVDCSSERRKTLIKKYYNSKWPRHRQGIFFFPFNFPPVGPETPGSSWKPKRIGDREAHEPQTVWLLKHFSKISFVKASTREDKSRGSSSASSRLFQKMTDSKAVRRWQLAEAAVSHVKASHVDEERFFCAVSTQACTCPIQKIAGCKAS